MIKLRLSKSIFDSLFVVSKSALICSDMQRKSLFLRFVQKNRSARPEKPADTIKNEGLAALHYTLLCVSFFSAV